MVGEEAQAWLPVTWDCLSQERGAGSSHLPVASTRMVGPGGVGRLGMDSEPSMEAHHSAPNPGSGTHPQ